MRQTVMDDKTRQMAALYENGWTLEQVGVKFRTTRQAVWSRFRTAGIIARRRPSKYRQIDKERLIELYSNDRLQIDGIADVFSTNKWIIRAALKYHDIPKRRRLATGGYAVDFLKKLQLHEAAVIEIRGKVTNHLYFTSERIGIGITVRSLGGGNKYLVTRIR